MAVDGSQVPCVGKAVVPLSIEGNITEGNCLVEKRLFENADVVGGWMRLKGLGES